ncbi:MAG: DUF4382 domain-containing protein [Anaerolineales bacterium]
MADRIIAGLGAIAAILFFSACARIPAEGTVQVQFSDHRDAIGDFSRLEAKIKGVSLHSTQARDWVDLKVQDPVIDLTQLEGDNFKQVLEQRVPADRYDAIRVDLTDVRGSLVSGEEVALDDFSSAARLEFELEVGKTATLMVDLKVQSEHDHSGGGYVLILRETREVDHNSTE